MLSFMFFRARGRTALWLAVLYSLFHYPHAMALDQLIPGGGVVPNIKLYYSYNKKPDGVFILRGVELKGGFQDMPVAPCGYNTDPDKNICVISFACGVLSNADPATAILDGYRLTDRQIYNKLLTKVGQQVTVHAGGQCMGGNKMGVSATATRSDGGGQTAYLWGDGSTEAVPDPPEIDPGCTISTSSSNNMVEIDYGSVASNVANNFEKSEQLRFSCQRNTFLKVSVPQDEVSLMPDGSLTALIRFNKPVSDTQKVLGSMGIFVNTGSGEPVNVFSMLKVKGTLKGGAFLGSTVIKVEYI
ncbi:hypothetical protein L580_3793 [Serratia fonticola AU-P3(3)]|nr:hypothetical protein L580_3793 [Serratia fonticola AU-P3(3)]